MGLLKEEYVPVADALLRSLGRDLDEFSAHNPLFNAAYRAAMQDKTDEVRAKETADAVLVQQKLATQELYRMGDELNKPLKLLNMVISKAPVETALATNVLQKIKKRNFEGVLQDLQSLKQVVASQSLVLSTYGMKEDTEIILENSITAITAKSNEQTSLRQQRKAFTSANKGLYSDLYAYISDVAKLGKIIYQGEQKASEYTIDRLIAMVHASRAAGKKQ